MAFTNQFNMKKKKKLIVHLNEHVKNTIHSIPQKGLRPYCCKLKHTNPTTQNTTAFSRQGVHPSTIPPALSFAEIVPSPAILSALFEVSLLFLPIAFPVELLLYFSILIYSLEFSNHLVTS